MDHIWLYCLALLFCCDIVTTALLVCRLGIECEANDSARMVMEQLGLSMWVLLTGLVYLLSLYVLYRVFLCYRPLAVAVASIYTLLLLGIAINNVTILDGRFGSIIIGMVVSVRPLLGGD